MGDRSRRVLGSSAGFHYHQDPEKLLTAPIKTGHMATGTCSANGAIDDNADRIEGSRSRGRTPIAGKIPQQADTRSIVGIHAAPTLRQGWHQVQQVPKPQL